MLPGNFTWLLLEISNFADFAAKHFPEAPDLGVGQRAGGDFVFVIAGGGRERRGWLAGVVNDDFSNARGRPKTSRAASAMARSLKYRAYDFGVVTFRSAPETAMRAFSTASAR